MYRGTHRRPIGQAKARIVTLTLALAGSTLAVPLGTTTAAHSSPATFDFARAAWLQAADLSINPAGPKPGQAIAPAVARGYVITGDQLPRFNITATPEGQQELAAFVARIQHNYGLTLDAKAYSVFATPPIIYLSYDELAGNLGELAALAQSAIQQAADSEALAAIKQEIEDQSVKIEGDDFVAGAEALVNYVTNPDTLEGLKQTIDDQSIKIDGTDPVSEGFAVLDLATSLVGVIQGYINNPPVTPPTTGELVETVDQLTFMIGALLANLGFEAPDQMAEDPTHVAPVGTDIVSSTLDGTLGDAVILPTGVGVAEVSAAWHEGIMKVSTVIEDTPLVPAAPLLKTGADQVPENDEPAWSPAGGGCYDRRSNSTAWYDTCRSWHHLAKDGDSSRETWGHKQFGTAKSKGIWNLMRFEVRSWPKPGTADQKWLDWSPRSDTDYGHCQTRTIGVNVNAAYLEHSTEQCEQWDIDKGASGADFANTWRGNVNRHERDVASVKSTSTPNGTSPVNYVRYDYYAR